MNRGKYRIRKVRALFGFALLFIALGAGNIVFGYHRAGVYEELLEQAVSQTTPSIEGLEEDSASAAIDNRDRALATFRKLKGSLDFYRTVIIGGKCFLAFAGFLLLAVLMMLRETASESDNKEPVNL